MRDTAQEGGQMWARRYILDTRTAGEDVGQDDAEEDDWSAEE